MREKKTQGTEKITTRSKRPGKIKGDEDKGIELKEEAKIARI